MIIVLVEEGTRPIFSLMENTWVAAHMRLIRVSDRRHLHLWIGQGRRPLGVESSGDSRLQERAQLGQFDCAALMN